ncbi:ATP-binding protein [Blautia sp. MSJ-19]|uniref:ATP-binding protein n=1 Tax=Blautia sp. MSJ-19 TaxID=2841517 RepID=UPI001C0F142A|nr:hypothetical protein [Blautia sp. MSJ-19]MBU5482467.1 hypothetical protein [Blautia sp. MSJ-19]
MKIRKIEIRDFGNIYNKTVSFTSGLNLLYTEKEQERKELQAFVETILFGRTEIPYAGILWFESGGRKYRLTRDLHGEVPYSELLCEDDGALLDADHISESKIALGVSEAVYENAICISPLKGNTGAEIVRQVQKQMTDFQTTGDCSVDPGRTVQRIKMTRKGYQVQVERRKKADEKEKKKISSQISRLRKEIRELEEQKSQIGEQENAFRMNEESNGYQLLDERISDLERNKRFLIAAMCLTVMLGIGVAVFLGMELNATIPAALAGIVGVALFMAETNFEMQTVRELEKRKRMRVRWLSRQEKLKGGRSGVEEELLDKNTELSNLTEELRSMEEYAYLPLMEELEIDALNLAMERIEKLSDRIYSQTGNQLVQTMSEVLSGITRGECRELLVDDEMRISVDVGDEIIPIEKLRLITVEQIYLSLRLAAGELLCGSEKLPVIFDEMFAAFDPERLKTAVCWLTDNGRQVIVSTSRKSEAEMVQQC